MERSQLVQSNPQGSRATNAPRAIIHKKILDAASEEPEAPVEELAQSISGASVELVDQVLKKYGDPGAEESSTKSISSAESYTEETTQNSSNDSMTSKDKSPEMSNDIDYLNLSEKQQHLLRTIYDHSDADIATLVEKQDLNKKQLRECLESIPNFEWERRKEIVENLFENNISRGNNPEPSEETQEKLGEQINTLIDNLESLEQQLDSRPTNFDDQFTDPRLIHKVIRACLSSDRIEEDEELAIIENLIR